jgi:lactobin A/cerein 7B family class IIb bacteriocin
VPRVTATAPDRGDGAVVAGWSRAIIPKEIDMTNNETEMRELDENELDMISGGKWSWKKFFGAVAGGAATGAATGAAAGGVGAGPGAVGGGLIGGIGYCISEIF